MKFVYLNAGGHLRCVTVSLRRDRQGQPASAPGGIQLSKIPIRGFRRATEAGGASKKWTALQRS